MADRKDRKKFYDALKTAVYGPKSSRTTPLLSADRSTLLADRDAILERRAENDSVLKCPSTVIDNAASYNRVSQVECNVLLDEFPTVTETTKAIKHLSSGKVPQEIKDASTILLYKRKGYAQSRQKTTRAYKSY